MNSIHVQLSSSLQRLAVLQKRVEAQTKEPIPLVRQTVGELRQVLERMRLVLDHLVLQREYVAQTRADLRVEREKYAQLFDAAPNPYIVTDAASRILEANRAAADLLNISQRFLAGKTLGIFVCRDRGRFLTDAAHLAVSGATARWLFRIRPRERAPLDVIARVFACTANEQVELHWVMRSAPLPPRSSPPADRDSESAQPM